MKICEAIEKYSQWRFGNKEACTVQHDYNFLRAFCLFVRNKDIEDIQEEDITEYIKLHYDLGYKTNGIQSRVSAIRGLFRYLNAKKYTVISTDLIQVPKKEWTDVRVATLSLYQKLLSVIPKNTKQWNGYHTRNRAIVMLLWDSGMRVGELCSIKTKDMDFERRLANIRTEKSRSAVPFRNIFWTEETNKELIAWNRKRQQLAGEYFFCQIYGDKKSQAITTRGVQAVMRKYAKRNDLGGVLNPHSFRHAFGERMVMKGAQDSVISSLMGHTHMESSFRYTRLSKENMLEKYRNLTKK